LGLPGLKPWAESSNPFGAGPRSTYGAETRSQSLNAETPDSIEVTAVNRGRFTYFVYLLEG
ncbi:MAG: hypothetical protein QOH78_73, partial [Verrucomicrobiota bacterium]